MASRHRRAGPWRGSAYEKTWACRSSWVSGRAAEWVGECINGLVGWLVTACEGRPFFRDGALADLELVGDVNRILEKRSIWVGVPCN